MAHALHSPAESPPTTFDLSCKDPGVTKYLKQAAHLLQEEQVMPMKRGSVLHPHEAQVWKWNLINTLFD